MQNIIFKSSMVNGLIMGVLFSINFIISVTRNPILGFISYIIVALILVGMYKTTVRFRDTTCEGFISYGRAFSYILLTFFFAAVISSAVKYIYFAYINPEYLSNLMGETMKLMEKMNFPIDDNSFEQLEKMMKPANMSLQFIWANVFGGTVVGLIMAAFIKKEKSIFEQ